MKRVSGVVIALFLLSMLSSAFNLTAVDATPVTVTYISDDSGATLAMDDAIDPSTSLPWYGPADWAGAVYAWGPTDGTGGFWNQYLHPSAEKSELLGSGANWIWKPTGTTGIVLGDGRTVYKVVPVTEAVTGDIVKFKRGFEIPDDALELEGTLLIAADNAFYLYVNKGFIGAPLLQGNFYDGYNYLNFRNPATGFPIEGSVELPSTPPYPWSTVHSIDISSELQVGANTLEIVGINEYSTPSNPGTPEANPAGVIYKLTVEYKLPAKICGYKFYDLNLNGAWDDGEPAVPGFKMELYDDAVLVDTEFTDENGRYCFDILTLGTYTVKEVLPTHWFNTTPISIDVEITELGQISEDNNFGNICIGYGGGKSLGFWSNKNGQSVLNGHVGEPGPVSILSDPILAGLPNTVSGPPYLTSKEGIKAFLLGATATVNIGDYPCYGMQYMLAAQWLTMKLNVYFGYVDGNSLVYLGDVNENGVADPGDFMTVHDILNLVSSAWGGWDRATQEYWKDILDHANNNMNFLCLAPCLPITYP